MSNPETYTIGWICAITTEFVAARSFFDEEHQALESAAPSDNNNYALGRIGKHNVVMAVMPKDEVGTTTAATVARDMLRTFPSIRFGLMVGIGGGAPTAEHDIRLGDIVVNTRGVFQFDYGKEIQGRNAQTGGSLNKPPQLLLTAISALAAEYELKGHKLNQLIETALERYPRLRKNYSRPNSDTDRLYQSDIIHPDQPGECLDLCGGSFQSLEARGQRDEEEDDPAIHYGLIASGNRVMKNAVIRGSIAAEKNVLCFEMEAAGLANHFPCVVIRGICDYSDSHKNDKWQGFASMVGAAYATDLLSQIPPSKVQSEKPIKEVWSSIENTAIVTRDTVMSMASGHHNDKILSWFSPPDYSSNANQARGYRHPGSGTWFLNSPEFQDWKSGSCKYLWLYGLVGCGKTVLSTSILDDLLSSDKHTTLAFFFDFSHSRKQTLDDLLRSLTAQLYYAGNEAAKKLDSLFASHNNGQKPLDPTALQACVDNMIEAAGQVSILIDALDECTEWEKVLQWIEHLTSSQAQILIMGRPEQQLKTGLFRLFGKRNCISLDKKAIDADIWSYVNAELEKRPSFVDMDLSPEVQNMVRDKIGNGAHGMFRWAACQLDVLAGCLSPRDIKTALESLPRNLDETYDRMIERIPIEKKPSAIRLLQFLVHTKRPLEVIEAVEVIATQIDLEPPCFSTDSRLFKPHDVLRYCPGLIAITKSRNWYRAYKELHLAHFSVKEYLLKQANFDLRNASIAMTRTCLAYLRDIDDTWPSVERLFPMAMYAAEHWTEYAILAEDSEDITRGIIEFLRDETKFRTWTYLYQDHGSRFGSENFSAEGDSVNAVSGWYGTALQAAVFRGNLEVVQMLLENGANVNVQGGMYTHPLIAASAGGNRAVLQLLLSKGVDIEALDKYHGSALQVASGYGNLKAVQCLLENGADANTCGGHFRTPALHTAVEHGGPEVIRLLLKHGANVHRTDYFGSTVLHTACDENTSPQTVRLLLKSGADVKAQSRFWGSALQIASLRGNLDTIQLLLNNGARINMLCGNYGSALYAALLRRDPEVVQFLLDRGADPNTWHSKFGTPLHLALAGTTVVRGSSSTGPGDILSDSSDESRLISLPKCCTSSNDGMDHYGKVYLHQEYKQSLTEWGEISVFMVGDTIIQIAMSKGDWTDADAHHAVFIAYRCFKTWRRLNPATKING
ncbi:hypothetical protein FGADI_12788 [Fusarium gaditjirri]|uniref:Nephrocystin 3-like N-terminal domain-containing protein n=1 Tax=Fusarium gaditjirri TaxID=282569 RepID=A0A8H4SR76_9HYPO|nr:hypothetical protein FGADI_12788 [Fusarium gaditjirri]